MLTLRNLTSQEQALALLRLRLNFESNISFPTEVVDGLVQLDDRVCVRISERCDRPLESVGLDLRGA